MPFLVQVIDKSFGFDTAVEEAQRAINAAHVESESIENGIGFVKLMGRYSGKLLSFSSYLNRSKKSHLKNCWFDLNLCLMLQWNELTLKRELKTFRSNEHSIFLATQPGPLFRIYLYSISFSFFHWFRDIYACGRLHNLWEVSLSLLPFFHPPPPQLFFPVLWTFSRYLSYIYNLLIILRFIIDSRGKS